MATSGRNEASRRTDLEQSIPALIGTGYKLTSDPSEEYNCVAWAAGDTSKRWDDENEDLYWPADAVRRDGSMASLMEAFGTLGYEVCDSSELEKGFEKIALYGFDGNWCHAARQLPNGYWSSKCGKLDDIAHRDLADVYCSEYGVVSCVMKRVTHGTVG